MAELLSRRLPSAPRPDVIAPEHLHACALLHGTAQLFHQLNPMGNSTRKWLLFLLVFYFIDKITWEKI